MRTVAVVLAFAVIGCRSSAPYTVPSALINSAIAVGVSGMQRAQGGCFAECVYGTTCNPQTGFCEPTSCDGKCQAWESCVENEAGVAHCVASKTPGGGIGSLGGVTPGVGVSPATGTVPTLPPEKASPEKP